MFQGVTQQHPEEDATIIDGEEEEELLFLVGGNSSPPSLTALLIFELQVKESANIHMATTIRGFDLHT